MQIVFLSNQCPEDYINESGAGEYPAAPKKCPFKNCGINLEMRKHGFYSRYLVTIAFSGRIRIRRYKCRKCGRTVSTLPSFCVPGYTYGVIVIVMILLRALETDSIKKTAKEWRGRGMAITRRHIAKHMGRLRENRKLIQYGLNQISPENANMGGETGDTEWTKRFLLGIRPTLSAEFNANFHKATGISFMSTRNRIA